MKVKSFDKQQRIKWKHLSYCCVSRMQTSWELVTRLTGTKCHPMALRDPALTLLRPTHPQDIYDLSTEPKHCIYFLVH